MYQTASGGVKMARTISIGGQDFANLIENQYFYVDKTAFIKEWWDGGDDVTLITRPRRFGKTITMSMLNYFFSNRYAGRSDLFEGLDIWKDEKFRKLQGTYPVIFLTFAGVKGKNYEDAVLGIKKQIVNLFSEYSFLRDYEGFDDNEKKAFSNIEEKMSDVDAEYSLNLLSGLLEKYYGKKVLIFLDEYDTPLQEAYVQGYWDEMTAFIRTMFNNTFKTNPSMVRAIMTGITRVSKESIFSDLNNLEVVTTTSEKYATDFGFTQEEVFASLDELGYSEEDKKGVRLWYDGFTFGSHTDIYNPWSITNFLDKGKFEIYWANTSGNGLVASLLQKSDKDTKIKFESLLKGHSIQVPVDEQIIFSQLDHRRYAIWSLLLAGGYLKVLEHEDLRETKPGKKPLYTLTLTNREVQKMFEDLITDWFEENEYFGEFVKAMLSGNVKDMNRYMNKVALTVFSYFDAGKSPESEPERFYHGFVLGLLVENAADYTIRSNRESGYGRYDVMMEPKDPDRVAVIMEFKVFDREDDEKELSDTAANALAQIEEKQYAAELIAQGIPEEKILKYGFAFQGKKCLIQIGK